MKMLALKLIIEKFAALVGNYPKIHYTNIGEGKTTIQKLFVKVLLHRRTGFT
jgi:hypothetical protein